LSRVLHAISLAVGLLVSLEGTAVRASESERLALLDHLSLTDGDTLVKHEPPREVPDGPRARRSFTVVVGGDLGLGAHSAPVRADGAFRHGEFRTWAAITAGLAPLIDGDLNFANLETVVTGRNDIVPADKAFNFRTHPNGAAHLVGLGFNLLSTANNHAIDYGVAGVTETVRHLDGLKQRGGLLAHAGVGGDREAASRPQLVQVKGATLAFSALGIDSGGRAGPQRPGLMAWRSPEDVAHVVTRLRSATADVRLLSVHQGIERSVTVERDAIEILREQVVLTGAADVVVGHHAHVVQGVEIVDGRVIFYGLGNLLHPGMQNMSAFGMCQDYGLMAKLHLLEDATGRFRVRAIEAIPLTDMHWIARRMPARQATERVHVLNHLATALDAPSAGAKGVRFAPRADGAGLYCAPDAHADGGPIGALCAGWQGAPEPPAVLNARIASACGSRPLIADRTGGGSVKGRPVPGAITSSSVAPSPTTAPAAWTRQVFAGD